MQEPSSVNYELNKKVDSNLRLQFLRQQMEEANEVVKPTELGNSGDYFKRMTQQILEEKVKANQANRVKELDDLEWISNFYITRQRRASKKPARDLINSIKFGRENANIMSKKKDEEISPYPVPLGKRQQRRMEQWRKGHPMHEAPGRPNFQLGTPSELEPPYIQQRYTKPKKRFDTKKSTHRKSGKKKILDELFSESDSSDTDKAKHDRRQNTRKNKHSSSDEVAEKHEQRMFERFERKLEKHVQEKSAKEIFKRNDPFLSSSLVVPDENKTNSRDVTRLLKNQISKMESDQTEQRHQLPQPPNDDGQSSQTITTKQPNAFFSTVSSLFAKMKRVVTIGQKQIKETQEMMDQLKPNLEVKDSLHTAHRHRHKHGNSELHEAEASRKNEKINQLNVTLPISESGKQHVIENSMQEKASINVRFSESTKLEDKHSKYRRNHMKTYSTKTGYDDKSESIEHQRNQPILIKLETPLTSDQHLKRRHHKKVVEYPPDAHNTWNEVTAGQGHSELNRHGPKYSNPNQRAEPKDYKQSQIQAPSFDNVKNDKTETFPDEKVEVGEDLRGKREQPLLIKVKVPLSLPKSDKEPERFIKEPVRILKWIDEQKKRTFEDEFSKVQIEDTRKNAHAKVQDPGNISPNFEHHRHRS